MKAEKYFGKLTGYSRKFDSMEKANEWLSTEEGDFRTRSLVSKSYHICYIVLDIV